MDNCFGEAGASSSLTARELKRLMPIVKSNLRIPITLPYPWPNKALKAWSLIGRSGTPPAPGSKQFSVQDGLNTLSLCVRYSQTWREAIETAFKRIKPGHVPAMKGELKVSSRSTPQDYKQREVNKRKSTNWQTRRPSNRVSVHKSPASQNLRKSQNQPSGAGLNWATLSQLVKTLPTSLLIRARRRSYFLMYQGMGVAFLHDNGCSSKTRSSTYQHLNMPKVNVEH